MKSTKNLDEDVKKGPLGDFFVWWDEITQEDVDEFKKIIDTATKEQDIQAFLEKKPLFLIQHLGGGHGRWVIPKKRLGAEHITDFMVGDKSSMGFEWQAVELESPNARMFNKNGDPSRYLTHAIRQIEDWRAWLTRNISYASRPQDQGGLGLTDISVHISGQIIIGRRAYINPSTNDLRRQMCKNSNIQIHSYDRMIDVAQGSVDVLKRNKQK